MSICSVRLGEPIITKLKWRKNKMFNFRKCLSIENHPRCSNIIAEIFCSRMIQNQLYNTYTEGSRSGVWSFLVILIITYYDYVIMVIITAFRTVSHFFLTYRLAILIVTLDQTGHTLVLYRQAHQLTMLNHHENRSHQIPWSKKTPREIAQITES